MTTQLKVTLSGGREAYVRTNGDAAGLQSRIVEGRLESAWLPLEDGHGVVRVDAIVQMTVEGRSEDEETAEQARERERLEARRRELAGIPRVDDLHLLERRGR